MPSLTSLSASYSEFIRVLPAWDLLHTLTFIKVFYLILVSTIDIRHGSPKGQKSVLEKIGVSAEKMGIKVISSKDQMRIGDIFQCRPVYVNKVVNTMDCLIGVNRIKPHTRLLKYVDKNYKLAGSLSMVFNKKGNMKIE